MNRRQFLKAMGAGAIAMSTAGAAQASETDRFHLLAHARSRTITLLDKGRAIRTYRPVAHGANGVASFRIRGDSITPSGHYRLSWRDDNSDFRIFFGLNYPTSQQAIAGFGRGIISFDEAKAIIRAHGEGRCPPQDTALGGDIGLHGVGWRNPAVNGIADWTAGCLAVSNRDIDEIAHITGGVGTPITIIGKDKI